ncbi:MAG: M20/M25/M40 family metallo-hydrolase [Aggregatilineales bacterium]
MRHRFARSPIGILIVCALTLTLNVTACEVGSAPPAMLHAAGADSIGVAGASGASNFAHPSPTPLNHTLPVDPVVQQWLNSVQSDQLLIMIDALTGMRTRHALSAGFDPTQGFGITTARDYLIAQFHIIHSAVPLAVWTQPVPITLNGVTATSDNVVAVAQGSDPKAGVIVVGAHYDSVNADDFNSADLAAPGANDNGSGVAALLEIARLLTGIAPRATLIFVAFTGEETGRQGSMAFVQNYLQAQKPPISPRAMFNLDTIGGNRTPDGQPGADVLRIFSADPNDSPSRQLARQVQLIAAAYLTAPQAIVQSSAERAGHFGDQQSFSAGGNAAVRLIESAEDPSRQRSARDTLDDIQPAYLMGATRVALASLAVLADGPDAPDNVAWHANGTILNWSPIKGAAGYVVALRRSESASFDQIVTIGDSPAFIWSGLTTYAFAAVAAFDGHGRMGPLSPEIALAR